MDPQLLSSGGKMMRALVVSQDAAVSARIQALLENQSALQLVKCVPHQPCSEEVTRLLALVAPDVVLVHAESLSRAAELRREIAAADPNLPVVSVVKHENERIHAAHRDAGFQESLALAGHDLPGAFVEQVKAAARTRRTPSTGVLCSFLPAKGGSGTSLLAANLSCALARYSGLRVLLAELDFACPTLAQILQTQNPLGIRDAVDCLPFTNGRAWEHFITHLGGLDILTAGRPGLRRIPTTARLRELLNYACSRYSPVCLDLSGNLETHSLAALAVSRTIFLVSSSDPLALHLAREKSRLLAGMGIADRTALLVTYRDPDNRHNPAHIEEFVELPVCGVFDLCESAAQKAFAAQQRISPGSSAGRNLERLADWIAVDFAPVTSGEPEDWEALAR